MFESLRRRAQAAGLPPGTLAYVGEEHAGPAVLEKIVYDAASASSSTLQGLQECTGYDEGPKVTWINIDGLHDPDIVNQAAQRFALHPLVLEDIVHTGQRPKIEELKDGSIFVIVQMLTYNEKLCRVEDEQVSFILNKHSLLSFQERSGGDVFDAVRKRILAQKGRICGLGPDYLMYALLDAIVDQYFVVLERMGEDIEDIEEKLLSKPSPSQLEALHSLRREALNLRRYIFPLREVVSRLEKGGEGMIQENTVYYLRDLYDHTIQVMDTVETFRDMLASMVELYLSNISLKMNEIMKVLAMFTSLFTPLTFLAGLYGMNFKNMPELEWPWGYYAVLAVMALVTIGMVLFFRKRGWIGGAGKTQD